LPAADRQHYSLVYGVNRHALLHNLSYFSLTSGALVPDIMHDILEGVLPLEVKLMLKVHLYTKKALNCILCIVPGFRTELQTIQSSIGG